MFVFAIIRTVHGSIETVAGLLFTFTTVNVVVVLCFFFAKRHCYANQEGRGKPQAASEARNFRATTLVRALCHLKMARSC